MGRKRKATAVARDSGDRTAENRDNSGNNEMANFDLVVNGTDAEQPATSKTKSNKSKSRREKRSRSSKSRRVILRSDTEDECDNNNAVPETASSYHDDDVVDLDPSDNAFDSEVIDHVDGVQVSVDGPLAPEDSEFQSVSDSEIDVDVETVVTVPNSPTLVAKARGVDTEEADKVDSEINFKVRRPNTVPETMPDFEKWRGNVAFENYIKKVVAQANQETKRGNNSVSPLQRVDQAKVRKGGMVKSPAVNKDFIKSPSDTTIYAPALLKSSDKAGTQIVREGPCTPRRILTNSIDVNNQISQFIEGIRVQSVVQQPRIDRIQPSLQDQQEAGTSSGSQRPVRSEQQEFAANLDQAKEKANQLIIEAEKFKAAVSNPPGMNNDSFIPISQMIPSNMQDGDGVMSCNQSPHIPVINMPHYQQQMSASGGGEVSSNSAGTSNAGPRLDHDDDFFHVSCHIDPVLKSKIQKGDFVDLDRLLPKLRNSFAIAENKMDLVFRDGHSYFVPAASESKINGVRKWEQAFRVYAAIYSEANPSRAAEIWQYVHIINVAASAYVWENVANYDYTFRHLMANNPSRSWARIYNQMWNISMRNPTSFNYGSNQSHNSSGGGKSSNHSFNNNNNSNRGGGDGNKQKSKTKYCWGFNKAGCKLGANCKFVNRCSYCDAAGHGKSNCPTCPNKNK